MLANLRGWGAPRNPGQTADGGTPDLRVALSAQSSNPGYGTSIELVVQAHLRAVDALERVVRAVCRCARGSDARPASRIGLIQGEVEVLDLDRPVAGPGPFDAAAGLPECAHSAIARTERAAPARRHGAESYDRGADIGKARTDLAVEKGAGGGPAGSAGDRRIPVADRRVVRQLVVEKRAVRIDGGRVEPHVTAFGFGAIREPRSGVLPNAAKRAAGDRCLLEGDAIEPAIAGIREGGVEERAAGRTGIDGVDVGRRGAAPVGAGITTGEIVRHHWSRF